MLRLCTQCSRLVIFRNFGAPSTGGGRERDGSMIVSPPHAVSEAVSGYQKGLSDTGAFVASASSNEIRGGSRAEQRLPLGLDGSDIQAGEALRAVQNTTSACLSKSPEAPLRQ